MIGFNATVRCEHPVWIFPQERFVEYEKKDERWCRFFGIGKEIIVSTPAIKVEDWKVEPVKEESARLKLPGDIPDVLLHLCGPLTPGWDRRLSDDK